VSHGIYKHVKRHLRRAGLLVRIAGGIRVAAASVAVAALVAFASNAGAEATKKAPATPKAVARADSTHRAPTGVRPPATAKPAGGVRTLDAINIEGEIAVPQVLFITARDTRRFRDGLGAAYRMTALEAARSLTLPGRVRVVPPSQSHKEEEK